MKTSTTTDVPVVGPREPCPCGSGKRYKVCHGKQARASRASFVRRPFEGLAGECDWIALREIVSAATAPLVLRGDHAGRDVVVTTLLPMAMPALVRGDGQVLVGLQTPSSTGDPSADVASALVAALDAEPGSTIQPSARTAGGPRLQDLVDPTAPLDVTVHDGFDYWVESDAEPTAEVRASLDEANAAVIPMARLSSVDAAYWCHLGDRDQVRWVMPYEEEPLLDGLARLHAADADGVGAGSRLLGTFRAHGRLVPVWDLAAGSPAGDAEAPAAALADRLASAVDDRTPLTADQRRARSGLANRQVTIR